MTDMSAEDRARDFVYNRLGRDSNTPDIIAAFAEYGEQERRKALGEAVEIAHTAFRKPASRPYQPIEEGKYTAGAAIRKRIYALMEATDEPR